MTMLKKTVQKQLLFKIDVVDDAFLVRAKWEDAEDKNFTQAIVAGSDVEDLVKRMQKPEDIVSAKVSILAHESNPDGLARATLVRANADVGRLAYLREVHIHAKSWADPVPENARVVFMDITRNAYYDKSGQLLNTYYADSVTARSYNLHAIIRRAEMEEWLNVPGRFGRDGDKIYHVPGNGETINVEFTLTPEEYQSAILDNPFWDRIENAFRVKGVHLPSVQRSEEEPAFSFE